MRVSLSLIIAQVALLSNLCSAFNIPAALKAGAQNGGIPCAACTFGVYMLEELSYLHQKPIDQVLEEVCDYFPATLRPICDQLVTDFGADIIKYVSLNYDGDEVCHALKDVCPAKQCVLGKPSVPSVLAREPERLRQLLVGVEKSLRKGFPDFLKQVAESSKKAFDPWQWLKNIIERVGHHLPELDLDNDYFSVEPVLRGSNWRGRDCNDLAPDVHPGKVAPFPKGSAEIDWNCNGIYGVNPVTKVPYEAELCGNSGQVGVAVIGDSAGAHFELPPSWFNASEIRQGTYDDLLERAADEFDLPMRSGYTGFVNSTPAVPVQSFYKYMKERNLCNHRDYQNLGVNGGSSSNLKQFAPLLSRNASHPLIVFVEFIGNDVCHPEHGLNHMTTVAQFRQNMLQGLDVLNGVVPKGSTVFLIGLADGLYLWKWLHARNHPLGQTYEEIYDYLNCLEINPCWAWMNLNETVREAGQKRADELTAVLADIAKNHNNFTNIELIFYAFPFKEIIDQWVNDGGQGWELIEPVDGFHPNQIANALSAVWFYEHTKKDYPHVLGKVNANNAKIKAMFGDQGGY